MPDIDFAAWEHGLGLARTTETARVLGISRQSVTDLRGRRQNPSRPLQRLMQVLKDNPEVLRRILAGDCTAMPDTDLAARISALEATVALLQGQVTDLKLGLKDPN